jgi:hypothetical protein
MLCLYISYICVFYLRAFSFPKIVLPFYLCNRWVVECDHYGMTWTGETDVLGENTVPLLRSPRQSPFGLTWDWKRNSTAINLLNYGVAHSPILAKMRKAVISFIMSVCLSICPSVRMGQLGSHWRNFNETWYFSIIPKIIVTVQIF